VRVHVGSDHAGFELKAFLSAALASRGHDVIDHGPTAFDPDDDYPPYCLHTAQAVVDDLGSLGVVIGGSGNGEQMAANKVPGIRAALAWSEETATLARQHNDATVVSIGARMHDDESALAIVAAFLATGFSGDPRHVRRIDQVTAYERTHQLPSLPTLPSGP
jgi:ribose 5-phosphate isomerase B